MIELDEELAYALADRLIAGDSMEQLDTEQAGTGFTFMLFIEGSTRWFGRKVENHRAQNWDKTKARVEDILNERRAKEVA